MLDVHILTLPGLPQEWVDQRRASIAVAVERAGYPVAVHEIAGEPGHLGRSRRRGYAAGTHPYVTHVDHDDFIHPEAFSAIAEHLAAGVSAITTGETLLFADGSKHEAPEHRHHLAVFRRADIERTDIGDFTYYPDQRALSLLCSVHVPRCLYMHRIDPESASRRQRRADAAAAAAEMRAVASPALFVAEAMTQDMIAAAYDQEVPA